MWKYLAKSSRFFFFLTTLKHKVDQRVYLVLWASDDHILILSIVRIVCFLFNNDVSLDEPEQKAAQSHFNWLENT